jgi:hypothetical protein
MIRGLDGADLAQRPLGERAALGGRERLGRGQTRQTPARSGAGEHVAHPATGDAPGAEARQGQGCGDRALTLGGVADRLAHDGVDHRRREPPAGGRRVWLGPQAGLSVRQVTAAVIASARDARVAASARDGDLAAADAVEQVPAGTCEAFRWGHDVPSPFDFAVNGSRTRVASLPCWSVGVSTSNAGTTR